MVFLLNYLGSQIDSKVDSKVDGKVDSKVAPLTQRSANPRGFPHRQPVCENSAVEVCQVLLVQIYQLNLRVEIHSSAEGVLLKSTLRSASGGY